MDLPMSMSSDEWTLFTLYDPNCPLCRQLAGFLRMKTPGNFLFCTTEEFAGRFPEVSLPDQDSELMVVEWDQVGGQFSVFVADQAWAKLLEKLPFLSSLNWLAEKIGVTSQSSKALHASSKVARFLCTSCPGPTRRRDRKISR